MSENINTTNKGLCYLKHIGLYVNNLSEMERFYIDTFNMKPVVSHANDSGEWLNTVTGNPNVQITKLITEYGQMTGCGDMLELIQITPSDNMSEKSDEIRNNFLGYSHIAFGINNIHGTIESVVNHGGKVLVRPFKRENGFWLSFCQDPEDNIIELIQN